MDRKKELLVRVYLVLAAFIVLTVVIMARVIKVSIIEGDKWRVKGDKNIQLRTLYADRGNIYSEDLNLLSTSLQFFEIRMDLTVAKEDLFRNNVDSLAYYLSATIGKHKTQSEWRSSLLKARRDKKRYFPIAKNVSVEDLSAVAQFPIFNKGKYGGGFIKNKESKRLKPYKSFASRTIGRDRKNVSNVGLEGYFDAQLRGDSVKVLMKNVSPKNNVWLPIYDVEEFSPKHGDDIVTTLNVDIQDVVHNELLKRVVELDADAATAVVMEVKTGAIKAISNFKRSENGTYSEAYNYAVGHTSEPGSTFKLATLLSLLDDGYCDLESTVDLKGGRMKFYDQKMSDSEIHGKGRVTLRHAFESSSNVGMSKLAEDHYNNPEGRKRFVGKLKSFGLVSKTGIEIIGEPKPYIKHPVKTKKEWSLTTIPWMAHGYELTLTPLQILNLYNSVANDGKMMKPYLVSDIINCGDVVKHIEPRVLKRKIAMLSVVQDAQSVLEDVVQSGTGRKLQSEIVTIAGKTGTTRTNYANREEEKEYNASFAGYFPAENPKYSMIVVVYNPRGNAYYGASAAGPAYKIIAERITTLADNLIYADKNQYVANIELPNPSSGYTKDFTKVFEYVGLDYRIRRKKTSWVEVDPLESKMLISKKKISKSKVPNVKGMGARDAIYVLENLGLNVAVDGVGKVVKQTVNAGSKIKGQDITIYLN
ncbi:MAG: penicillin-binding protein [Saprospiraceae bacterium]